MTSLKTIEMSWKLKKKKQPRFTNFWKTKQIQEVKTGKFFKPFMMRQK